MPNIDLRQIVMENADAYTVASSLGYRLGEFSGPGKSRKCQMICPDPAHNDQKFGNCYLFTETKRYHCYACHSYGTIIDMVMLNEGWDPKDVAKAYDAMKIVADICNIDLPLDQAKKEWEKNKKFLPKLLRYDEQELISLHNGALYDTMSDEETGPAVSSSMLNSLRQEDPEVYARLVVNKCNETEQTQVDMIFSAMCQMHDLYEKPGIDKWPEILKENPYLWDNVQKAVAETNASFSDVVARVLLERRLIRPDNNDMYLGLIMASTENLEKIRSIRLEMLTYLAQCSKKKGKRNGSNSKY